MENLPQDIILDMLSRLPVNSVVQFRCVCKSWRSLISKPQFVKTHLNRAIAEDVSVGCQRVLIPNYIRKSYTTTISLESIDYEALQLLSQKKLEAALQKNNGDNACTVLDFPYSDPDCRVYLVGSCHGMVGMEVDGDKIVICNPCTREFRELPKPSSSLTHDSRIRAAGGLGYDSSVDDYKFVIVVVDYNDREIKAEIFSLRSNSWRMLHDINSDLDIKNILGFGVYGSGVFLNGALHWIGSSCENGQKIISFDLATEKFQELVSAPRDPGYTINPGYDNYSNLIVLGGYLSVSDESSRGTEVWVMKEYGVDASWSKLFTLRDPDINLYNIYHYVRPVCFSKDGELVVDLGGDQIKIYNPKEQNPRVFYNGSWWLRRVCVYIESLVSPNGNVENN